MSCEELKPMKEAPKDVEILAYHVAGKTFHPVIWRKDHWGMRWNKEYRQYDDDFLAWVEYPTLV